MQGRVVYDTARARWIFIAVGPYTTASQPLLVAVSQTDDPTGNWLLYKVELQTGFREAVFLRARLGVNKNWIAVSVARLDDYGGPLESRVFAFDKEALYAGRGTFKAWKVSHTEAGRSWVASFCPAQTLDNTPTMFLVENGSSENGTLRVSTITGAVGAETLTIGVGSPTSSRSWSSRPTNDLDLAPQLGRPNKIYMDDASMRSVVCRNGSIWAAHTVFYPASGSPTRSSIQVWELDATSLEVKQLFTVDDPTGLEFYGYPSVAANGNGDVLVGYSRFSSTTFASAAYSFRKSGDPLSTLPASQLLKAGEASYYKADYRNFWGTVSSTCVDPSNDSDFWTIQEYAALPSQLSDRWATWWGKVPGSAAPSVASWVITMSKSTYGIGDTITATEFGPRSGAASTAVRIEITLTVPTIGKVILVDIGGDGSFVLPANTNVNLGPLQLVAVASSFPPKGAWSLDSKVTTPTTGVLIAQDVNPFVVQ
ncbi:MAG: hypothetical protein DMG07_01325 [Acidobacteria bacterium]|nr:MAG: hypothetical protein DMG07_01325 [Acidobacteriota bacterium]